MNGRISQHPGDHKGTLPDHPTALAPTESSIGASVDAYWIAKGGYPFCGEHWKALFASLLNSVVR